MSLLSPTLGGGGGIGRGHLSILAQCGENAVEPRRFAERTRPRSAARACALAPVGRAEQVGRLRFYSSAGVEEQPDRLRPRPTVPPEGARLGRGPGRATGKCPVAKVAGVAPPEPGPAGHRLARVCRLVPFG